MDVAQVYRNLAAPLNLQLGGREGLPYLLAELQAYFQRIQTGLAQVQALVPTSPLLAFVDQFNDLLRSINRLVALDDADPIASLDAIIQRLANLGSFYDTLNGLLVAAQVQRSTLVYPVVNLRQVRESLTTEDFVRKPKNEPDQRLNNVGTYVLTRRVPIERLRKLVLVQGSAVDTEADWSGITSIDELVVRTKLTPSQNVVQVNREAFVDRLKQDPSRAVSMAANVRYEAEQPEAPPPQVADEATVDLGQLNFAPDRTPRNLYDLMAWLYDSVGPGTRTIVQLDILYLLALAANTRPETFRNDPDLTPLPNVQAQQATLRQFQATMAQQTINQSPIRNLIAQQPALSLWFLRSLPFSNAQIENSWVANFGWAYRQASQLPTLLFTMLYYVLNVDCFSGTTLGPELIKGASWLQTVSDVLSEGPITLELVERFWELPYLVQLGLLVRNRQSGDQILRSDVVQQMYANDPAAQYVASKQSLDLFLVLAEWATPSFIVIEPLPTPYMIADLASVEDWSVAWLTDGNPRLRTTAVGQLTKSWYRTLDGEPFNDILFTRFFDQVLTPAQKDEWVSDPGSRYYTQSNFMKGFSYPAPEAMSVDLNQVLTALQTQPFDEGLLNRLADWHRALVEAKKKQQDQVLVSKLQDDSMEGVERRSIQTINQRRTENARLKTKRLSTQPRAVKQETGRSRSGRAAP